MQKSPFKFLDSYTKEDRDIFFGREKEVEEIYSRVFQSKLLLICGVSGTGKSSLIHCGLANKFKDSDWLPIVVRKGNNINESLLKSISAVALTPFIGGKEKKASLNKSLRSLYLDHFKPVCLVFDQFEELFIFGNNEEKQEFIKQVSTVVSSDIQCKFIFVIREEYLAPLIGFESEIPEFFSNRIRIEKMSRYNALEVINGPCRFAGINTENDFAQNLLEKLSSDKTEVELTYLQVYLDKIYKKAFSDVSVLSEDDKNRPSPSEGQNRMRFTNQLLASLGKISDVLSDFLEEQLSKIPDSETALTILKSFVSTEGTKKQITVSEIDDFARTLGKNISIEGIECFVRQFVDLRILRDKDENNKYELRHDSLAAKIYEKITLVEKEIIEVRQIIQNRYNEFLKRKTLLNADDLKFIAPYEDKLFLNAEILKFVSESRGEQEKSKKRKRILFISSMIGLIVIMAGFTFWALNERNNALEQSKLVAELKKQIDEGAAIYDKVESVVIPNSRITFIGEEYRADVFTAAYNSKLLPTVKVGVLDSTYNFIGDYKVLPMVNGRALYSVKQEHEGKHEWGGIIEQPLPNGMIAKYPFMESYLTMRPALVISPTSQNILMRGINNPVSIAVSGMPPEKLRISITNGSIKGNNGNFMVLPGKEKECIISVSAEMNGKVQRFGEMRFRVKNVPDPKPFIGRYSGTVEMTSEELLAEKGLIAKLENFEFEGVKFEIIAYDLLVNIKNNLVMKTVQSAIFDKDSKTIFKNVEPGGFILLYNIKAKGPEGQIRDLSNITIIKK